MLSMWFLFSVLIPKKDVSTIKSNFLNSLFCDIQFSLFLRAKFCNTNADSFEAKEIDDGTLNQVFTLNSRLTYYMTLIFANLTWKEEKISYQEMMHPTNQ